tara:strand:+ start:8230 stop:8805 length:576 start_codon:yes stop_codon:yes gene_type:complete
MSQEKITSLMDKINLLINVFMKDGLEKVSQLEKDLLKEQVLQLLEEVNNLTLKSNAEIFLEQNSIPETNNSIVEIESEALPQESPQIEVEEAKPLQKTTINTKKYSTHKPFRSLKSVIDLNKSFILKAELFPNDLQGYNQFINQLSQLDSEEESFILLREKTKSLHWDKENIAYELLVRAVEKRFLPLLHR